MSQPTIDQIRGIGDFATLYQWDVAIAGSPAAINPAFDSFALNVRCESAEIPILTGQSIEVMIRGHKTKQPGIYGYNNIFTLVFVETVDNAIQNFLRAWREVVWETGTGFQARKADTQALIHLTRLDRQLNPIWRYALIGCYLEDYNLGTLDGSTSDALKPNIILSYDYFKDGPA